MRYFFKNIFLSVATDEKKIKATKKSTYKIQLVSLLLHEIIPWHAVTDGLSILRVFAV